MRLAAMRLPSPAASRLSPRSPPPFGAPGQHRASPAFTTTATAVVTPSSSPATLPRALFAAPSPSVAALPRRLDFAAAAARLALVVARTQLQLSRALSRRFGAEVWLKREDLTAVRSYKLRGASHLIRSLSAAERARGVVCASAGNHTQGVAFACRELGIRAVIYMPAPTPRQKVEQTRMWGEAFAEVRLTGDTFEDAQAAARAFCEAEARTFVLPFDDWRIVEGQGTVALEVLAQLPGPDFVFMPVGGGGLSAGMGLMLRGLGGPASAAGATEASRAAQLVGIEPLGAPSMLAALRAGEPVRLERIETFVDGASVKRVGDAPFAAVRATLDVMHAVPEGRVCTSVLELYNREGLVAEPAGTLAVAALEDFASEIRGRKVVCVVSGGNADVDRLAEIKERSLRHEGLRAYFLVRFAQRAGALREFVAQLPASVSIVRFEYMQRTNAESGPALVGLELAKRGDIDTLRTCFALGQVDAEELRDDSLLLRFLL